MKEKKLCPVFLRLVTHFFSSNCWPIDSNGRETVCGSELEEERQGKRRRSRDQDEVVRRPDQTLRREGKKRRKGAQGLTVWPLTSS